MKKKPAVLVLMLFLMMLLVLPVCAQQANDAETGSNPALFFPALFIPVIVVYLLLDPQVSVKALLDQCRSSSSPEKRRRRIDSYLSNTLLERETHDWLLEWKPDRIARARLEASGQTVPADRNRKAVIIEFEDGLMYRFGMHTQQKGERGKSSYWLVEDIRKL